MRVEDEGVSEVIREKIALMHQKIAVLNTHWLEETKGLHLSPDGILLTPDGRPLPDQTRGGGNIARTPDGRMLDQSVVDGRGAQNGVDREGRMETQMLTSEYGQWRSLDDEWRHLVEALREVSRCRFCFKISTAGKCVLCKSANIIHVVNKSTMTFLSCIYDVFFGHK